MSAAPKRDTPDLPAPLRIGVKVITSLAYITVIGFVITVSLVVGIWGIGRMSIEREYLTLDERIRLTEAYVAMPVERQASFIRSQIGLSRPLIAFNTSLAYECQELYLSADRYFKKAHDVIAPYATRHGVTVPASAIWAPDQEKLDLFTNTAIEFIRQYDACVNK